MALKVLLLLNLLVHTTCANMFADEDGEEQLVFVARVDNHFESGEKRFSLPFPPTMTFDVIQDDSNKATLNLRLNDMATANPTVYLTVDGEIKKVKTRPNLDTSLYQDLATGSAMTVRCPQTKTICDLTGTFYIGAEEYQLRPNEDGKHHYMKKLSAVGDERRPFGSDYVKMPEELSPLEDSTFVLDDGRKIVEVFAFPDETFYEYYIEQEANNETEAIAAIKLHFAHIANQMDLMYQTLKLHESTLDIRIYLAGVHIAKIPDDSPWSLENTFLETYLGDNALEDFSSWQLANKGFFNQYDHAAAFTRKDFCIGNITDYDTGLLGIAFLDSMCSPSVDDYYKTSVNEDRGFFTAPVVTHEVGHSFGSYHDGEYRSDGCADSDWYIMAAYAGVPPRSKKSNPWYFSKCSAAAIKEHLENWGPDCLMDNNFTDVEFDNQKSLPLAGEFYSLDDICQWRFGLNSSNCQTVRNQYKCGKPLPWNMCHKGFWCTTSGGECDGRAYVMPGSPCGTNKWCQEGNCVDIPQTTTATKPTTNTTTETPVPTCEPTKTNPPRTTTDCYCPTTTPPPEGDCPCYKRVCCYGRTCCRGRNFNPWGPETRCCKNASKKCCALVEHRCAGLSNPMYHLRDGSWSCLYS